MVKKAQGDEKYSHGLNTGCLKSGLILTIDRLVYGIQMVRASAQYFKTSEYWYEIKTFWKIWKSFSMKRQNFGPRQFMA